MNRYLYVPLLFVAACTEVVEEPAPPDEPSGPSRPPELWGIPDKETQGRWLLGENLDGLPAAIAGDHVSVSTAGTTVVGGVPQAVEVVAPAVLVLAGTATVADDLILPVGNGAELVIKLAAADPGITKYHLLYRSAPGARPIDPCGGGVAQVFTGRFTTDGRHVAAPARISFACEDGVAFKCSALWGYHAGIDPNDDAWPTHQACTRMARADLCGDGVPHTEEGTTIAIFDEFLPGEVWYGVQNWPPSPTRFFFEAGWTEDGAVCLSHLRWSRLPVGDMCLGNLPDPRANVTPAACEELGDFHEMTIATGARIHNASRYNDLALHVWRRGDDRVATVDGYYGGTGAIAQPYPAIGNYTWVRLDGFLLRSIPESLATVPVEDVQLYASPAGDAVYLPDSAATLAPGFTAMGWRGFLFPDEQPGTVPFVLYQHAITGDLLTAAGQVAPAYQAIDTVGYVGAAVTP